MKHRINTLKNWQGWALNEDRLHHTMDRNLQRCLHGKRRLLLEKIATSLNWPDVGVHEELRRGFKLTGYARRCGIFKTEPKLASMDKSKLLEDAKFLRPSLRGKVRRQVCDEDHAKLYEMTKKPKSKAGLMDRMKLNKFLRSLEVLASQYEGSEFGRRANCARSMISRKTE